jgi:ribosomal protein L36
MNIGDAETLDDNRLGKAAICKIDNFIARYFDDNNWCQELCLVLRSGRVAVLCKESHFRGLDEEAKELANSAPKKQIWEYTIRMAWQIIGSDMELKGACSGLATTEGNRTLNEMSNEEVEKVIHEEVPTKISDLYLRLGRKLRGENINHSPHTGRNLRTTDASI